MTYFHDAIVLLGRRYAGKDTVYRELADVIPNVYNVKFANLSKHFTSVIVGVPPQTLEDKETRVKHIEFNGSKLPLSCLDIVNALYFGAKQVPAIIDAAVKYAFDQIHTGVLPVFTDVRRLQEIDTIIKRYTNPLFVLLDEYNSAPFLAEDSLAEFFCSPEGYKYLRDKGFTLYGFSKKAHAKFISENIIQRLQFEAKEQRVLVLYADDSLVPASAILYEPMQEYVDATNEISERFGMTQAERMSLFQHLINMFSCDDISLQVLDVGNNHMIYFPKQHEALLPRLQKMADKTYYVGFNK